MLRGHEYEEINSQTLFCTGEMGLSAQRVNLALNVAVIAGLILCIILAGVVMKDSYDAALLLADTKELAQELRQSSDDLTRFIRTYTVTGNRSYWDYFQQVIRIRNGVDPLPIQPWRNYWDLYISDGHPPRGFSTPYAILARMEKASFTQPELDLLNEAKRQSDALIDMEDQAYNAMNGKYRPIDTTGLSTSEALQFSRSAPVNQTFAMQFVHGTVYHQWKGRIMRPIDEFAQMANQRVLEAIDRNFQLSVAVVSLLAVMLIWLVALLCIYFGKIASDAQTSQLLNTMLPARVVETVELEKFKELRAIAAARSLSLQLLHENPHGKLDPMHHGELAISFPVLYSEFLPLAWVAFTDVVDFTTMCRTNPAKMVIAVLNELFSLLDVEATLLGVEKIKTIGDAFMAAKLSTSELRAPIDEATRTRNVSQDGVQMVVFLLRAFTLAQGVVRPRGHQDTLQFTPAHEALSLRCGLHAGPVASGIVGFERPLYDLFGDTVNTASRLESSGVANRIQVMESTLHLFDEGLPYMHFDTGLHDVNLKGIGRATTRFIRGYESPTIKEGLIPPRGPLSSGVDVVVISDFQDAGTE